MCELHATNKKTITETYHLESRQVQFTLEISDFCIDIYAKYYLLSSLLSSGSIIVRDSKQNSDEKKITKFIVYEAGNITRMCWSVQMMKPHKTFTHFNIAFVLPCVSFTRTLQCIIVSLRGHQIHGVSSTRVLHEI